MQHASRLVCLVRACAERLSTSSTFKIGVVRERPEWNHDQTLANAFSVSAVWCYQRLARETGEARMQDYLDRIHHGNEDISGGMDHFWLGSSLRTSADEQVDFLRRLLLGQLPFPTPNSQRDPSRQDKIWRPAGSGLNWFVGTWSETATCTSLRRISRGEALAIHKRRGASPKTVYGRMNLP